MATFHYIQLRAFAHETEDPARVREALRRAAGDEKLDIAETAVEGSHKNRILILEAELKSAPAAKRLFGALAAHDPEGMRRVVDEVDRRLDENLNFYVRLDKQAAYQGRARLASGDDAITLRGKVRSFQSKRAGGGLDAARNDLLDFLHEVTKSGSPSFGQ